MRQLFGALGRWTDINTDLRGPPSSRSLHALSFAVRTPTKALETHPTGRYSKGVHQAREPCCNGLLPFAAADVCVCFVPPAAVNDCDGAETTHHSLT